MAYESERVKRVGTEELRYGVYELHLNEEDTQRLSDESDEFLTELLAEAGAPAPNEIVDRSKAADWIDDLIKTIRSGGGGGGGPTTPPPTAILLHQESGAHISRYIWLVTTS